MFDRQIDDVPFQTDPLFTEHVKLGLTEGRGNLVFDNLDFHPNPDRGLSLFEGTEPPHVNPAGTVKLESPPAGSRFGAAEHDPDLFPDLVDEDHAGLRPRDGAG